jgi:D-lactate dehydrogenase
VDTTALVAALNSGKVAAAALDVVESEYLLDPDELIDLATHDDAARETLKHAVSLAALTHMPNVIVTNHNAYNSRDAIDKINQTTLENIFNFIDGKEVHSV